MAFAATKVSFARMPDTLEEALSHKSDPQSRLAAIEDHAEAKAALVERRSPRFSRR